MIERPTVLIVGAGASIPYNLPGGRSLSERAIALAKSDEFKARLVRVTRDNSPRIASFLSQLKGSGLYSIDALLDKPGLDASIQKIGKGLIASTLLPYLEAIQWHGTPRKWPDPITGVDTDWIRFVWNQMHRRARTFDDLKRNRLSFVTFNFDTIIETKLSLYVYEAFQHEIDYMAARSYVGGLIHHVHGTFEEIPKRADHEIDSALRQAHDLWVQRQIDRITVVHEEIDPAKLIKLTELVDGAQILCFLGLGYLPENLKKLGFPKMPPPSAEVYGTAFGLDDGDRRAAVDALGLHNSRPLLGAKDKDCLQFLRQQYVLRA